jgi:L-iditol 2-dehydrogenase
MKALVLQEYKRFAYEEVEPPAVGPGEVLVAVKACGICGSDVHGMDGSSGRRRPPIIMGHEAAGVIAETGPGVEGWSAGERVTFDSTVYCGECHYCRAGQINLCDRRRVLGVSCEDYRRHGAFADYVTVPARILYRVPAALPIEHAALVEPTSVAFHAVRRTPIALNDTAVVVGAGMIGLLVIQALRLAGCGRVIAVDIAPGKLDMAVKLGATETVNSGASDAVAEILRLTGGRGADVVAEAVGVAATVELALRCARKGGAVMLVGNVTATVPFPLQVAVTRELSLYGSCGSCGEYTACLETMARGDLEVGPLISAVAPLAEGPQWFDRLYRKEPGLVKVILAPGG